MITSFLDLVQNVCLVIRQKKPTLGGKGPGYRLSAAVEDGDWLHRAFRLQSLWFVCSGRSPQPPGHLHKTMHGHSQLSAPGGAAEGRVRPGGSRGLHWGSTASGPGLQAGGCCFPHSGEWFAAHIQALCLIVFEEYGMNIYQRGMFLSTAYFTM